MVLEVEVKLNFLLTYPDYLIPVNVFLIDPLSSHL